ncbi:MAG: hypothetical protein HYR72_27175 [Deltaproteobacteria bacterium]|nr:hypothetical protein [Deltaproteobacteria bacterium]MBI3390302.1 hypothetical protein [Deltaproteobacteria bacterium]
MARKWGLRSAWFRALMAVAIVAGPAFAEVTTERPGSIIIWPKIIASGTRDTIIQISNVSNSMVHAHCFYVNAALEPAPPPQQGLVPKWQEVDFDIWLTKQQPTHWVASLGRRIFPLDPECTTTVDECNDAGLDPGRVPPVPPDFVGELKCIEVDSSGAPISGNHLKGEATLVVLQAGGTNDFGDVSKYSALAVVGLDTNDANNVLCLGGGVTSQCVRGAEYNACPQTTLLTNFATHADNPQLGDKSEVLTEVTIVPCTENFEAQKPSSVVVQFQVTNEFEETFSASTTVTCWGNFELSEVNSVVFDVDTVGSRFLQTRMIPIKDSSGGILAVAEEFHRLAPITGRAAFNLYTIGERATADVITIPEGP